MKLSTILTSLSFLLFGLSEACAPADVEGGENSDQDLSVGLIATMRVVPLIHVEDRCKVNLTHLQVSLPNAKAEVAINKVLLPNVDLLTIAGIHTCRNLDGRKATADYLVTGSPEVAHNAQGILSVSQMTKNPSRKHWDTHTFDLKTGEELFLSDILSREGVETMDRACASSTGRWCRIEGQILNEDCLVEAGGIRWIDQYAEPSNTKPSSTFLMPWRELEGMIRHPSVKRIAESSAR